MRYYRIYRRLRKLLQRRRVKYNYSLKKYNTYRLTCRAKVVILIDSLETFCKTIKTLEQMGESPIILGYGSNVILAKKRLRSVVMVMTAGYNNIYSIGNSVVADSGALISQVVEYAKQHCLSGVEGACGIPGSIGGAVYMNASAYGYETGKLVSSVLVYRKGKITELSAEELQFGYRWSCLQDTNDIILRVQLDLTPAKAKDIKDKMIKIIAKRNAKQLGTYPNAGSVFKNGNNYFAGELIDKCKLKNYNIRNIYVSDYHANFLENRGRACGRDVLQMIDYIRGKVLQECGVELQLEQKIIGEDK